MGSKFILLCACGWKLISESANDSGIRELNNDAMGPRKFRCPQCGFAVTPRPAKDPQGDLNRRLEEERLAEENKKWLEKSLAERREFIERVRDGKKDDAE